MANKILVAEDVGELRSTEVIHFGMYCKGVEILQAATKEEALLVIENTDGLKVVVTDLRMPDAGDGEAVARAAQQKGIKVIILSGTLTDLSEDVRSNCIAVFDKQEYPDLKDIATFINGSLQS